MVFLVTGKKNEGKTTVLKKIFANTPGAQGFCSEKVLDCGRVTAYELENLSTGEKSTLARLSSLPVPADWGEDFQHGPFRFRDAGFTWAAGVYSDAMAAGAKAFFIDELGKLELNGQGLSELIRQAVQSGIDLYIAVRDRNIDEAIRTFAIGEHEIIRVSEQKD